MTLKLPIFLVVTGDQPADPDAPSTAEIATVVGDFGTGPVAANIFTDHELAERVAWQCVRGMTLGRDSDRTEADVGNSSRSRTSKRHADWKYTIDDPRTARRVRAWESTYADTADAVLEALAAA